MSETTHLHKQSVDAMQEPDTVSRVADIAAPGLRAFPLVLPGPPPLTAERPSHVNRSHQLLDALQEKTVHAVD